MLAMGAVRVKGGHERAFAVASPAGLCGRRQLRGSGSPSGGGSGSPSCRGRNGSRSRLRAVGRCWPLERPCLRHAAQRCCPPRDQKGPPLQRTSAEEECDTDRRTIADLPDTHRNAWQTRAHVGFAMHAKLKLFATQCLLISGSARLVGSPMPVAPRRLADASKAACLACLPPGEPRHLRVPGRATASPHTSRPASLLLPISRRTAMGPGEATDSTMLAVRSRLRAGSCLAASTWHARPRANGPPRPPDVAAAMGEDFKAGCRK
jgi:hypothetical protein